MVIRIVSVLQRSFRLFSPGLFILFVSLIIPLSGNSQTTVIHKETVGPPVFSHPGGFYTEPFELTLTHPDPGVTILYTLDGSIPCYENLNGSSFFYKNHYAFHPCDTMGEFLSDSVLSLIYQDKILIYNRSGEADRLSQKSSTVHYPYYFPQEPVMKAITVRATSIKEGMMHGKSITHSYFVIHDGAVPFSLPVVSLVMDEDKLFDYVHGIYTPGLFADQWRLDNPNKSYEWPFPGNFHQRGYEWEHPAHFELFAKISGERVFAQDIGLRLHGGATSSFPLKSLRIYAREALGNPQLNYPFFDNRPDTAYKRLILRNSGNDFPTDIDPWSVNETMFRDAAIQEIVRHLHIEIMAYEPVVLFLNGEYWGIMNIRERFDKYFLQRVFGVDPDNIDLLTGKDEVKEGDNLHFLETRAYIQYNGLEDDDHYDYIQTRIDVENFIDYQISNIFARNTDWPGNNIDFWRLRTDAYMPRSQYGHDGRWRWLLYDTDFGFGLRGGENSYAHNTLAFATEENGPPWPNPPWSTFLLRSFLKNDEFKIQFINRFADQLNTAFLPERTKKIIESFKLHIASDMAWHITRWGYPDSYAAWEENVNVMLSFAENRPEHQKDHILQYFDIDTTIRIQLDVDNPMEGTIRINTIQIRSGTPGVNDNPYPWAGQYFKGVPVEIEAIPEDGYEFSHWEGSVTEISPLVIFDSGDDLSLKAFFLKTEERPLIYYWLFDSTLPNDTPLEVVEPLFSSTNMGARLGFHSALAGYPFSPGHPDWRKASMERRNAPTEINYRPEGNHEIAFEDANMRGLQIRQPFTGDGGENTMVFHLPANGLKDLIFSFAAKDEGAAGFFKVDYSIEPGEPVWITNGLLKATYPLHDDYQLFQVNFTYIHNVNGKPDFKIRIRFGGADMSADNGDRVTFNNFSLSGRECRLFMIEANSNQLGEINPSGKFGLMECAKREFMLTPNKNHIIISVTLNGACVTDLVQINSENKTGVYFLSNPDTNQKVFARFGYNPDLLEDANDINIYPNPSAGIIHLGSKQEIYKVEFFDYSGRKVKSVNCNGLCNMINAGHLESGVYFIRVYTDGAAVLKKIVIVKH
jgi:hypothetical protein